MKAIFEVDFDNDMMIDQKTLNDIYDGDWMKLMQELYQLEGMGIFEKEIKLIEVRE